MGTKPIDEDTYSAIHRLMPIVCIDVVVMVDDQVLLIKRDKEPAKGQYWFPGGRLLKDERVKDAAVRLVKAETNIQIKNQIYLDFDETVFEADPFGHEAGTHTVNLVFAARARSMDLIALVLDENHTKYELFDLDYIYNLYNDIDPYVRKFTVLAEAAFRRR